MTIASPAPGKTGASAPPAERVTVAGIRAAISPVLAELSKTALARNRRPPDCSEHPPPLSRTPAQEGAPPS